MALFHRTEGKGKLPTATQYLEESGMPPNDKMKPYAYIHMYEAISIQNLRIQSRGEKENI